jgi:hypothetical protein
MRASASIPYFAWSATRPTDDVSSIEAKHQAYGLLFKQGTDQDRVAGPGHCRSMPLDSENEMSVRQAKPFRKSILIFSASLAFAFCSPAARAGEAEAVTVDTTFTVRTPPVRLDRPALSAPASVDLMARSDGLLSLSATGTIIDSTGNFLIRQADLFLRHGLNVMMADAAPAHPRGLTAGIRLSVMHAAELQGSINAALNRWGKPVWVAKIADIIAHITQLIGGRHGS